MGKKRGKAAVGKGEFDDFFSKNPDVLGTSKPGGWHTSTAAMALDEDEGPQAPVAGPGPSSDAAMADSQGKKQQKKKGKSRARPAGTGSSAKGMDIADGADGKGSFDDKDDGTASIAATSVRTGVTGGTGVTGWTGVTGTTGGEVKKERAKTLSKIPGGLGVVLHTMKRGDRTTKQKRRKTKKLVKALERSDKVGVRVDSSKQRKANKLSLKHMY